MIKQQTGLGANAHFAQFDRAAKSKVQTTPGQEPRPVKVRTTVVLSAEAFAHLETLKVAARHAGQKRTYSDILDAAIRLLKQQTDAQP